MTFQKESDFEEALIKILTTKGWESTILKYPTEQDLIRNWANILFDNNRGIDRLGDYPLTDGEMQQIVEQIRELRTPLKLNGFINGKTVSVKRDNPDDKAHFGKEVSLKIYDRMEIAAGQSRYQIVQQPIFPGKSKMLNDRRGDLMLLINGMPVFHLELKRSGVPVSQAYNQIEKYAHEGVFTGLFSLVQIFVAMNPEETVYFANPGPDGKFNTDYYFHWADFNNEPINDWKEIASKLLSIPFTFENRAHFWNFANSELAPEFLNEPQELGLPVRGIFYGEEGFRHFFTVNPVSGIADFKGLKLRVSNDPVMNGMVEGLGANPTVVSFGELYSALQTGVVDGAEQPIANYKSNAFPEVANNLILDGHTLGAIQAVITDNAWGKLTENQQAAIMEAGADTQAFNADLSESAENKVLDELKSSGCNVVDVPDKTPWQEACAKVISENTSDQAELYQQLLDMKA